MMLEDALVKTAVVGLMRRLQKHPIQIHTPIEVTWGDYVIVLYAAKGVITITTRKA